MTLPIARDLAPMGIRVVTIAPGEWRRNETGHIVSFMGRVRHLGLNVEISEE